MVAPSRDARGDARSGSNREPSAGPGADSESADRPDRVKVGIAEYAVADGDTELTTSGLGSCVGVALYDPDSDVAGMVHVMLPAAAGSDGPPAKFADAGVELLLAEMERAGADPDAIRAKIAGGSDMLDLESDDLAVGERNVVAVENALATAGVEVVAADVEGDGGRSLVFRGGDLQVRCRGETHTL
ncbi:MAG: chemotaxis protein CheD [Halobacteriaceae archaeon]